MKKIVSGDIFSLLGLLPMLIEALLIFSFPQIFFFQKKQKKNFHFSF